jgi:hypothetical protein
MIAALVLVGGVVAGYLIQSETLEGFAPGPPEAPVLVGNTTGGGQGVSDLTLTEEEKAAAMHIIESDAHVGEILKGVDWHVKLIGPMTQGDQKIGAAAIIKFDGAVWMEDTFSPYYPSGYSYVAKLWVRNMFVYVDLRDSKIVGLTPNMGRAPITSSITSPITSEERAAAAEISLSHPLAKALGENVEAYLNAVYYIDDYPKGIVLFNVRSELGEAFIAIDLDKMVVAEQYTTSIVSLER